MPLRIMVLGPLSQLLLGWQRRPGPMCRSEDPSGADLGSMSYKTLRAQQEQLCTLYILYIILYILCML